MDRYMYVCAWGGIVYDMLVLVLKEVSGALHGVYWLLVLHGQLCLLMLVVEEGEDASSTTTLTNTTPNTDHTSWSKDIFVV